MTRALPSKSRHGFTPRRDGDRQAAAARPQARLYFGRVCVFGGRKQRISLAGEHESKFADDIGGEQLSVARGRSDGQMNDCVLAGSGVVFLSKVSRLLCQFVAVRFSKPGGDFRFTVRRFVRRPFTVKRARIEKRKSLNFLAYSVFS
ncbi:MAG: hypothetical protein ACR65T_09645 [Methylocystis sp.]|uniref:hypothetical protein n=1 Tax=Methylocystis sp. TaxID=1911079 RepID=UPI003DA3C260